MLRRIALPSLLLIAICHCSTMQATHERGFLVRSVRIGSTSYPYVVYVPAAYDPHQRWPVILFLHGAGERGTDGLKQTQIGVGAAIRAHAERVPAIVVFPQVPLEQRFIGEPADAAMLALDRTMREYNGDPARTYLTGLSMGGYGTWHLALANPDRFAALVVVCGGIVAVPTAASVRQSPLNSSASDPYAFTAHALRHLPIWIFHGTDDQTIPVTESSKIADALRAENADVHFTEYPGVGHNAWDRAYNEPDLWTWLFAQRKSGGHH